jgi:hypothetical protein
MGVGISPIARRLVMPGLPRDRLNEPGRLGRASPPGFVPAPIDQVIRSILRRGWVVSASTEAAAPTFGPER